jgi:gamma-glutamyltranspeptidase/glutathione hydrolase
MSKRYTRREMLSLTGQALVAGAIGTQSGFAAEKKSPAPETSTKSKFASVSGEATGAAIGEKILAGGGNAIDAAVAAALTTCVTSPGKCGVGGYGGHLIVALADAGKITSIDFNSTAPAAARPDMYPLDEKGAVIGNVNFHGWQAVGVPGTMAGLQLALDRYGTRPFRELVAPAIELAEKGCRLTEQGAATAARIFKINPLKPGEKFRNPKLAALLKSLARQNSVESFYRGDIARRIAAAIGRNGGLVTFADLTAYHAREVEPLHMKWKDFTVHTAPLTAGGLTILEMLSIAQALNWENLPAPERTHARLEAQRCAWKDRLELLGDPESVRVPVERLLSGEYARETAATIQTAVKEKKPLTIQVEANPDEGTTNISAVDKQGNMVAITLTHGHGFGAQVLVEEFGLVLGHGMSRFNPRPGHPNSVAPGKRPLHNMCPSIVVRAGKPVLALGGAGGLLIPNSMFNVLLLYLTGASMEQALAAPRLQNTGTLDVSVEKNWPEAEIEYLKRIGFKVRTGLSAFVSAASFDPRTGERHAASR